MRSSWSGPFRTLSKHSCPGTARRRDRGNMTSAQNCNRVRRRPVGNRGGRKLCRMGRRRSHYRGKVAFASFRRASVVGHVVGIVPLDHRGCAWGRFRYSTRNINDQRLVNALPAGIESIERAGHDLLGSQGAFFLLISGKQTYDKVGRVKSAAERVGIFTKYHVANVIDQIIFVDENCGG